MAAVGAGAVLTPPAAAGAEACTGEAAAYERAVAAGTTEALQEFLSDYPSCPLTMPAFALLNALVEPAAGTAASPTESVAFGDDPPTPPAPPAPADLKTGPTDPGRPDRPDRDSAY